MKKHLHSNTTHTQRILVYLWRFTRLLFLFLLTLFALSRCENLDPGREIMIRTDTITNIGVTSCIAKATLLDPGKEELIQHGFCWATTQNPTVELNRTLLGPTSAAGEFSDSISGLVENTMYYLKAYAATEDEVYYGEEKSFTTLAPDLPVVSTSAVTDITSISAVSGGTITDDGGVTISERGVCWNTTGSPTIADDRTSDGSGTGSFISTISGLDPITPYFVKAYATNSSGTAYGSEISFTTTSVRDVDGNIYETIKIGDQWWMAENLKTTRYADESAIPLVESNSEWNNLGITDKAFCFYENSSENETVYGALYTWAAAMNGQSSTDDNPSDVQGVCPAGWHLPSDAEWKQLEMHLGLSQSEADEEGNRGTDVGSQLAGNADLWFDNALEDTDEFGTSDFMALPGGGRDEDGTFVTLHIYAGFWTTRENLSSGAWNHYIYTSSSAMGRFYYSKKNGFSVRCVKD